MPVFTFSGSSFFQLLPFYYFRFMHWIRQQLYLLLAPNKTLSQRDQQQLLAFVDSIWIGSIPVFGFLPLFFFLTEFEPAFFCMSVVFIQLVGIMLTLKFTGNFIYVAHACGISVFNSFTLLAYYTGGVSSPVILFYIMMIPATYDMGGIKTGLFWTIYYLIGFSIVAIIDLFIYPFPNYLQDQYSEYLYFIAFIGIFMHLAFYNQVWSRGWDKLQEELKDKQTLLNRQEKMASVGQLMAGIAHEINNPVNYVSNGAKALKLNLIDLQELSDLITKIPQASNHPTLQSLVDLREELELQELTTETQRLAKSIYDGIGRIQHITKSLQYISYSDKDKKETINLHESIEAALTVLHNKYKDRITVKKDFQAN
ncbi:MAG: hypothetical protein AAGJ18_07610, partial [Bacteroidota bacterium]